MKIFIRLCAKKNEYNKIPVTMFTVEKSQRILGDLRYISIGTMELQDQAMLSNIITFVHTTCKLSETQKQIKFVLKHKSEILDQSKNASNHGIMEDSVVDVMIE